MIPADAEVPKATGATGETPCCGSCRFLKADPGLADYLCVRRAPVALPGRNGSASFVHPTTIPSHWCGEYEPKPSTLTLAEYEASKPSGIQLLARCHGCMEPLAEPVGVLCFDDAAGRHWHSDCAQRAGVS